MNQLTPDRVRVAIIMMRRASCTGDEAKNVAASIDVFEGLHKQIVAANKSAQKVAQTLDTSTKDSEDEDGNDA